MSWRNTFLAKAVGPLTIKEIECKIDLLEQDVATILSADITLSDHAINTLLEEIYRLRELRAASCLTKAQP
jgi:hypothetical protein